MTTLGQSTTENMNPSMGSGAPELTENAAKRILELVAKEPAGARFRVSVDGGGCSGFQYRFGFDTGMNPDDIVIEKNGVKAVIDAISAGFLGGSKIDFVETLGESYFAVKNPNATASCGCGNSFAV